MNTLRHLFRTVSKTTSDQLDNFRSTETGKNAQKYLQESKKYLEGTKSQTRQYLNDTKSHTKDYISKKSSQALNQTGQLASQGVQKSAEFIGEQNRRLWRMIDFKNRTLNLLRSSGSWILRTRVFRYTRNGLIVGTIIKGCYVYGTRFEREIEISRTFIQLKETSGQVRNQYFVADHYRRLYQVVPSLWYWQWWPDELWSGMKEGEKYHIQGYGYRVHKLRIHPRLVHARKIDPDAPDLDNFN